MASTISDRQLDQSFNAITPRPHSPVDVRRLFIAGGGLVLLATTLNALLATGLRAWLAVPASFQPLGIPGVVSLTVIGMIGAIMVFGWTASRQADPGRRFTVIAAGALLVSWLPDILIWVARVFPGTTTSGVLSLMSLHLVAAGCAVLILTGFGVAPQAGRRAKAK